MLGALHMRRRAAALAAIGALGTATPAAAATGDTAKARLALPIPASERLGQATAAKSGLPSTTVQPRSTPLPSRTYSPPTRGFPLPGSAQTQTPRPTPQANPLVPSRIGRTAPALSATSHRAGGSISREAIVAAALAALLALACLAWGVARAFALEPRWLVSLRHSMAEAGSRASATWAELADWARLGH
jgi:hypothetical protein